MKKYQIGELQISHFNYDLPDDKIARYPLSQRDTSKLLLYRNAQLSSCTFNELPALLPQESLLLFNNTRVIHARLLFYKETGAQIEIFCLSPHAPADYALNFQQRQQCSWHCMIGNAKKWKEEALFMEVTCDGEVCTLKAEKKEAKDGEWIVLFSWNRDGLTFSELLELAGKLPVPPYLNRPSEASDDETYQTVYSRIEGSVAAPTAGLHFTPNVMEQLQKKGIATAEVTLHVGAGTFRPVKSNIITGHTMHTEFITVERKTVEKLLNNQGKLIVVGTTSLRTVESLYYIGRKLHLHPEASAQELSVKQWEPYDEAGDSISPTRALQNILVYLDRQKQDRLITDTQIIIVPGYHFHYADAIITNFHQPQSTLLLLIAAFVGNDWKRIYDYALHHDYRFLSYGDSSLLWKKPK
jgi:S-adenosylmethionine:tRNA ribosyltransferase-isomerase